VAEPPAWEVCTLGDSEGQLLSAQFYKNEQIALMYACKGGGNVLALASHANFPFAAMPAVPQGTALLDWTAGLVRSGELSLHPLLAERSRQFAGMDAAMLALSQNRGMASIATRNRRVLLLDLEEDGNEDDNDDPME